MYKILVLLFLMTIMYGVQAQYGRGGYGNRLSGTTFTDESKAFWTPHRDKLKTFNDSLPRGIRDYPIKIHILRMADGSEGIGVEEVKEAIRNLNSYFLKAYIRFIPLDDYNYINNDDYFKFQKELEPELAKEHDVPNVINLYIVKSIKTDKNTFNAFTYPPGAVPIDRIFITQKALSNKVSLVREMGHYFSLYPTHGPDEDKRTDELVDGSNCATTGDEICDTPADPRLTPDVINDRCEFIGTHKDGNAKFFRPHTNNVMSDNTRMTCINALTRQQYARIMYACETFHSNLVFPKSPFNKKQIKDLEDRYGIDAEATLKIDGQALPVKLDRNLYVGTRTAGNGSSLQLDIVNNRKCYIYVLEGDTSRRTELVYPKGNDKLFFTDEKAQVTITNTGLWKVDDKSGYNYVMVLFSKKQLPIDDWLKKLNSGAEENKYLNPIQRLYKYYAEHIAGLHDVNYNQNTPKVSGIAAERYIVPIFIQFTH